VNGPKCNHHAQQMMCDLAGDPDLVVVPPLCVVCTAALNAEKARADDLSRTVAAMGEHIDTRRDRIASLNENPKDAMVAAVEALNEIDKILSRPDVTAERGRWVSVEKYAAAMAYRDERDAAIARAEKAEKLAAHHEAKRDEVGIQLAAQSERLRLADSVIKRMALGVHYIDRVDDADRALAEWRAVPGDVLADRLAPAKAQHPAHVAARIKHGDGVDETARWVGPDGEPER
jgi:hypothetical protein